MSQVVVTEDSYNGARQATLQQERRINCEAEFDRFHLSDVTKMYGVLRAVFTPILLPVIIAWSLLMAALTLAVGVVAFLMRGIASILPKK